MGVAWSSGPRLGRFHPAGTQRAASSGLEAALLTALSSDSSVQVAAAAGARSKVTEWLLWLQEGWALLPPPAVILQKLILEQLTAAFTGHLWWAPALLELIPSVHVIQMVAEGCMNDGFGGPELRREPEVMNRCGALIHTIFTRLLASLFFFCGVLR